MLRNPVISTHIAGIGYNRNQCTLEIEFLNGSIYNYYDVPIAIYLNLINARSHGRFFNHHIKPYFMYCREE